MRLLFEEDDKSRLCEKGMIELFCAMHGFKKKKKNCSMLNEKCQGQTQLRTHLNREYA